MSPPWQAWFNQLYVYLTQSSSGGGGVVNFNTKIGTTLPLEGGDKIINNPVLSIEGNGISNNLLALMPNNTLKGNNTGTAAQPADLTAAQVGALLNIGELIYPQTAAEISAGVTPVNFSYASGDSRRMAPDTTGATDVTTKLQNLLDVAGLAASNGDIKIVMLYPGTYKVTRLYMHYSNVWLLLMPGATILQTKTGITNNNTTGQSPAFAVIHINPLNYLNNPASGSAGTITNVRIYGGGTVQGPYLTTHAYDGFALGVVSNDCHKCWVTEINILGCGGESLLLNPSAWTTCTDLRIIGNEITQGGEVGINNARDFLILYNFYHDNWSQNGLSGNGDGGVIGFNRIRSTAGSGLTCGGSGARDVNSTRNIVIIGNEILNTSVTSGGGPAIFLTDDGATTTPKQGIKLISNTINLNQSGTGAVIEADYAMSSGYVDIENNIIIGGVSGVSTAGIAIIAGNCYYNLRDNDFSVGSGNMSVCMDILGGSPTVNVYSYNNKDVPIDIQHPNLFNIVGSQLYKQTTAETAVGVTPNNYAYAPGHSFRYGAVGDGVTDDTAALNRLGSINVPAYIPYTSGKGYKTTSTVTFKNPTVICDGQLYAVGIVSNNGQSSGSYTATTPAVILSGVSYARGLFVEGDASAKTNNTIGIRVDGSQVTLDRCGASQCGFGCVVNGFIMQFTNCYFTFNSTGMTIWGGSVVTGINSILINGGSYGGNTDFAVNVGDTRFAASANPRGAAIRLEGFNCDGAPIQVDQVVAFSARNIYFEYSSIGTAGFILGGSGANNLRGCDIDSCFFNNMKFAVQCLNSVSGLKLGRANFYTGVTISAVKYSDMTQGAHYESGASSGSFANGQEVAYNFPGQNLSSINWGGITNDKDGLVNGVEIGVAPAFTKWFPGGVVLAPTSNTRTVNVSSSLGVYYTTPVVSIAGTMSSNQFTFTTKSQCVSFNGGDRLTGSGAASAATVILGMDYDNGIATLDTTGSGAATISQVAVSTATETIP